MAKFGDYYWVIGTLVVTSRECKHKKVWESNVVASER